MKRRFRFWVLGALALLALLPAAASALAEDRAPFRQEELDQMLAPIALYPDPLLSQVLMASTYPLEVVQAARWSRANPGLKGPDAVNAVAGMDWEPSVKSLTAFPHVLAMMSEKLDWTERLGEAFLEQQGDVMNTVQGLRQRAEATGYLRSSDQMRVEHHAGVIVISPPAPGIVYVPHYDPALVYGPWWWPAYPPVAWAPPPAHYAVPHHPHAWLWGSGIVLSTGFFFGHFDWPHRHVVVRHHHHAHHHGHHHDAHPVHVHRVWRHNPVHRRGVPFRHAGAHRHGTPHRGTASAPPAQQRSQPAAPARVETRVQPPAPARIEQRPRPAEHRQWNNRREPRAQARPAEPRRAAPAASPAEPRPALTSPAVRAESRAHRPAPATRQPPPQRQARIIEGGRRAHAGSTPHPQPAVRSSLPAPSATAPSAQRPPAARPAPRFESSPPRGHGQARGRANGHQRAPAAGRDHGRRS